MRVTTVGAYMRCVRVLAWLLVFVCVYVFLTHRQIPSVGVLNLVRSRNMLLNDFTIMQ